MAKPVPDLWRLRVTIPGRALAAFEAAAESFFDTVATFLTDPGDDETDAEVPWVIEALTRTLPDQDALDTAFRLAAAATGVAVPAPTLDRVPDIDWVSASLRNFPPIAAGRYFIHGSHFEGPLPSGRIALTIDAGTAFGSGEHASTWGCLMALDLLARRRRFRHPLDLGCGSGILALAMARTWPVPVLATDIDAEAVRVTRYNAGCNRAGRRIRATAADGYRSRLIMRGRPYDLIVANILARPLVRLAPDLAAHLAADGVAVLSGLLARQERMVLAAHRRHGLSLLARVAVDNWRALVLARAPRTRPMVVRPARGGRA